MNTSSNNELLLEGEWIAVSDRYPDTLIPLLVAAYNKPMNRTSIAVCMYEGSYGQQQRWSALVLIEDERKWYTLDTTWEVTHWAYIQLPQLIEKLNSIKKVTKF